MHTLICVTFSLPLAVGGWLRLFLDFSVYLFAYAPAYLSCFSAWCWCIPTKHGGNGNARNGRGNARNRSGNAIIGRGTANNGNGNARNGSGNARNGSGNASNKWKDFGSHKSEYPRFVYKSIMYQGWVGMFLIHTGTIWHKTPALLWFYSLNWQICKKKKKKKKENGMLLRTSKVNWFLFVLLFNVQVNDYGHVKTVT